MCIPLSCSLLWIWPHNTKGMISGNASGQQFSLYISPWCHLINKCLHTVLCKGGREATQTVPVWITSSRNPQPVSDFTCPSWVLLVWVFFLKLVFIQVIDIAFKYSVGSWTSVLQPHCVWSCLTAVVSGSKQSSVQPREFLTSVINSWHYWML